MSESWRECELGELASIRYGYTAKASQEDIGPKFLRITVIQNGDVNWANVPTCSVSSDEFERHRLRESDIVFARTGATTGKSYRMSSLPEAVPASYLIRVRITDEALNARFLEFFFKSESYWRQIRSGTTGSAQGGFNASKLSGLTVPVPPLAEQEHIVAILDEAFAGVETAIANTEKNLANAQELFESHLNTVFDARRPNWRKTTLGELYRIGSSKRVHKKDWMDRGVPFYRARQIVKLAENGVVDNELFISEEMFEEYGEKTGVPQDGDLMVTAVGTLGSCYAVQPADRSYFKDASVLWFRPKARVNAKFIQYAFRSPVVKRQTTDSQGATVGTLTISRANSISITVPELEVQDEIARSLEEIESGILELRAVQQSKLDALRELKQSLLQKAFSGELTADRVECEIESVAI